MSIDYFPTIREMSRVPNTSKLDGISLMLLLRGGSTLDRKALFWHYPHYSNQGGPPSGAVRAGSYKLIEFYEDGRLELYNLHDDPGERHNIVATDPNKTAELHAMLKDWRGSVGALMPLPNPNYDASKAEQGLYGSDPAHQ